MTAEATQESPKRLDIQQILSILPHRFPFVMVDRVNAIVPFESIEGHKCVSINEPFFPGHFPGHPIFPGVLILEAMAQLGGLLAHSSAPFDPEKSIMLFLGIDQARFRHPVVPGDRLDLRLDVVQQRGRIWKLKGEAKVEGKLCAEAQLMASIADR